MTEANNNPPEIAEELAKMQHEELLPVEKKLILVSLVLGVVLLAILLWLSKTLFPS
jgi:multisubunit Na+/H+ antiporter MnhC subunit